MLIRFLDYSSIYFSYIQIFVYVFIFYKYMNMYFLSKLFSYWCKKVLRCVVSIHGVLYCGCVTLCCVVMCISILYYIMLTCTVVCCVGLCISMQVNVYPKKIRNTMFSADVANQIARGLANPEKILF